VILAAAAIAVLNIRLNAAITGIFLAIELAALAVVTVLGITHAKNWSSLIHPVVGNAHGGLTPVPFTAVLAVTAVAVFSYNGYNGAVVFAEETTGSSKRIARALLLALVITVAAELIPVTATIVGSPSLAKLSTSAVPMQYFIEATSNKTVYTIVSLGVVIAILNACIAGVLSFGRILFSSGRDRAWPGPVSGWMARCSPRCHHVPDRLADHSGEPDRREPGRGLRADSDCCPVRPAHRGNRAQPLQDAAVASSAASGPDLPGLYLHQADLAAGMGHPDHDRDRPSLLAGGDLPPARAGLDPAARRPR
jgi:hypothetical protein